MVPSESEKNWKKSTQTHLAKKHPCFSVFPPSHPKDIPHLPSLPHLPEIMGQKTQKLVTKLATKKSSQHPTIHLRCISCKQMDVSENSGGTRKSSILIGFPIINHPFWGVSLFLVQPLNGISSNHHPHLWL